MKETFKLYYKDILLGTVLTGETNFPSTSGQIEFTFDTLEKENELRNYIDFSIEASNKVLGDVNVYGEFINREELKYQSIIDSVDWTLESRDGVRVKILVPVFLSNKGINFRFQ
jgi:hypothetical protein